MTELSPNSLSSRSGRSHKKRRWRNGIARNTVRLPLPLLMVLLWLGCGTIHVAWSWSGTGTVSIWRGTQRARLYVVPSLPQVPTSIVTTRLGSSISSSVSSSISSSSSSSQLWAAPRSSDDEAEWQELVAAFSTYRAAYGDLKVPSRFVVPGLPPWPESSWGLKLGQRVSAIRSTGKYVQNNEERTKQLEELGFVWRLRSRGDGSAKFPKTVVSAADLELAKKALTSWRSVLSSEEETTVTTNSDDSESDTLPVPPQEFVVPDCDPWPEEVRGLPLGRLIPSLQRAYPEMVTGKKAFENPPARGGGSSDKLNDTRFERVCKALWKYKEIYGDMAVQQPFVIPEEGETAEPWPEELRGLRLGARVNSIRCQGTFVRDRPDRRQRLTDMGFLWESPNASTGEEGAKKRGRRRKTTIPALEGPAPPGLLLSQGVGVADGSTSSSVGTVGVGSSSASGSGSLLGGTDVLSTPPGTPIFGGAAPLPPQVGVSSLWNDFPSGYGYGDNDDDDDDDDEQDDTDYVERPAFEDIQDKRRAQAMEAGVIQGVGENDRIIKRRRTPSYPWFDDDFGTGRVAVEQETESYMNSPPAGFGFDDIGRNTVLVEQERFFEFEDVVEALNVYKEIHGTFDTMDCSMNHPFVVPDSRNEEESSPSLLDNAPSLEDDDHDHDDDDHDDDDDEGGQRLERQMQLMGLDMDLDLDDTASTDTDSATMITATATATSITPNKKWPEHLAGMPLGNVCRRMREGDLDVAYHPERRAQLDAIGFPWGSDPRLILEIPFDRTVCALFAYYLIRGDTFVDATFQIPDDEPWPKALAGFNLGEAVYYLRSKQFLLERYYPHKVAVLNMFEFVWFPTLADPLDVFLDDEFGDDEAFYAAKGGQISWERELPHPLLRINDPPMEVVTAMAENYDDGDDDDDNDDLLYSDDEEGDERYMLKQRRPPRRRPFDYEIVRSYYEDHMGIQNMGKFLRDRGYEELANEHEAKYGVANVTEDGTAIPEMGSIDEEEDDEDRDGVESEDEVELEDDDLDIDMDMDMEDELVDFDDEEEEDVELDDDEDFDEEDDIDFDFDDMER